MENQNQEWRGKGATLSEKTARKEFGLTQSEIAEAIRVGKLQCRVNTMHGNPWLRLLRREVEDFVRDSYGDAHLEERRARTELAHIDRELKALRSQLTTYEERRAEILAYLGRP